MNDGREGYNNNKHRDYAREHGENRHTLSIVRRASNDYRKVRREQDEIQHNDERWGNTLARHDIVEYDEMPPPFRFGSRLPGAIFPDQDFSFSASTKR